MGTGSLTTRTPLKTALFCLSLACSPCSSDTPESDPIEGLYRQDALFLRAELLTGVDKAPLIEALEALNADLPELSVDARIVLQNDLWGLHERAQTQLSDPALERITELTTTLAQRVAVDDVRELAPDDELPSLLAEAFPDVVEHGTEMPILSHESAFGFRRVFRVAVSVDRSRRVLFSQLAAFDRAGRLGVTRVVGEVESLWFTHGELTHASVWKLSRGRAPALHEVDAVTHVPSLGADSFFIEETAPVALDTLPCLRCHEDDDPHSLPRPDLEARPRWQRVLDQLSVPTGSVGE